MLFGKTSCVRKERPAVKFQKHDIDWTAEKSARFWDYCQQNESLRQHFFGFQAGYHVARIINREIGFKKLHTILDLSCGQGDIIEACLSYLKNGQNIYGTDFSAMNVEYVNSRFMNDSRFKGAWLAHSFPTCFQSEFFDLVIITEVIEHLDNDDLKNSMKEVWRILRKGGHLLMTTQNQENLDAGKVMCPECGCVFHKWQHIRWWSVDSLRKLAESNSFSTNMLIPILWAKTRWQQMIFPIATFFNLLPKSGLLYIGRK